MSFGEEDQLPRTTRNTRKGAFFVLSLGDLYIPPRAVLDEEMTIMSFGAADFALRVKPRYLWGLAAWQSPSPTGRLPRQSMPQVSDSGRCRNDKSKRLLCLTYR